MTVKFKKLTSAQVLHDKLVMSAAIVSAFQEAVILVETSRNLSEAGSKLREAVAIAREDWKKALYAETGKNL